MSMQVIPKHVALMSDADQSSYILGACTQVLQGLKEYVYIKSAVELN